MSLEKPFLRGNLHANAQDIVKAVNSMSKPSLAAILFGVAAVFLQVPAAPAAVIRGIVVEKSTGYSLAHASITLQPVSVGRSDAARSGSTNDSGQFEFDDLAAGAYVLEGFPARILLPGEYGQKRWNSAGTAIVLENADATFTARLPLARYGSITGTVRDANEVGLPDQEIAAYTNTQPPRFVVRAQSDERGIFRIPGLEPGGYLIRTTGNYDGDRSYLPTFSRQTLRVEEARAVTVYPDEDANDGDVRPIAGRLFDISGSAAPIPASPYGFTVTVTLASDMRQSRKSRSRHSISSASRPFTTKFSRKHERMLPGTEGFWAAIWNCRSSAISRASPCR